ncbi:uncharacterized protein EAF01_008103 [Botrytis porri]|nr:uncharacterized protein EAF01_008103 [Botrytis porri]KAF7898890.1 hypothetical protein EAF01_008103 [Botrytis porri]
MSKKDVGQQSREFLEFVKLLSRISSRTNFREIRTASSFFTDEPSNQSTLCVTMGEPAIDTNHALSVVKPFIRTDSTTIDSNSDREPLAIAKPISQTRKSVIKETSVGKKAEKGDKSRRKRILARDKMEKGDVNENKSGSDNGNESIIVVENKRVDKTIDDSEDEDEDEDESESENENESVIKVENENVINDRERQEERSIKIEDDSGKE